MAQCRAARWRQDQLTASGPARAARPGFRLACTGLVFAAAVVCGACSSVHLGKPVECTAAAADPPPPAGTADNDASLKIVTWNLHGTPDTAPMEARIRRVSGKLLAQDADIVLLQEVWFAGDARMLANGLAARYDQVEDDKAVLSGFLWPIVETRRGGLLAFVRKNGRWRLRGPSVFTEFEARAPFWKLSELDGLAAKGIQRFEVESGQLRLIVLNTHLQAQYGKERPYETERRAQVAQLHRSALSALGDGARAVLIAAGDFNTLPDESRVLSELATQWKDVTASFREACNCGTLLTADSREGAWIDYAFIRMPAAGRYRVKSVERIPSASIDCPYSDHHGLQVGLEISFQR